MTNPNDLAISIRDARVTFGSTKALDGANLSVKSGESHALLGRNGAGKSTLISVLTGLVTPDSGDVEIRSMLGGEPQAAGAGSIACVYQKSTLVDGLSAAENICLGNYPTGRFGAVDWKTVRQRGVELLSEWGFSRIVDQEVGDLAPLERKVVEVCRALSQGPRILLLDEPTAGLDEGSSHELFAQINQARERGVTVVYVSHHLDEVFKVCDAVTILRDGRDVDHARTAEIDEKHIVDVLSGGVGPEQAGSPLGAREHKEIPRDAPVVLSARELSVRADSAPTSVAVRAGEAVGLTGLDGAGHIQLAQALAGQLPFASGDVRVGQARVRAGNVNDAIRAGIGFVPEDRHISGYVPEMSVEENSTLTVLTDLTNKFFFVDRKARRERYYQLSKTWTIKASSPQQPVQDLSGGNQQKVVLARALASNPRVLILVHPTAGVDVTAKESIYASIRQLQDSGCAVIVVSSDDDDLEICDRVLVMFKGALDSELPHGWSERELVAAVQGAHHSEADGTEGAS
jgi:ABC-type sugar transport system, ATPase component